MNASMYSPDEVVPLDEDKRSYVSTKVAAIHLGRSEQTLRLWAYKVRKGGIKRMPPVVPTNVYGRLRWAVADIRAALGIV